MITTILIVLLIGSTLILSTAAIVTRLLPRSSAASRFSIWQIAVTSLLLLPIGVLLIPEIPLGLVSNSRAEAPLSSISSPTIDWHKQPSDFASFKKSSELVFPQLNPVPSAQIDTEITTVSSTTIPVAVSPGTRAVFKDFRFTMSQIAMAIWLALALALLLRTLLAHFRVALATRSADLEIDSTIADSADWLPDSVDLAYSDRHTVPVTIGIWRPRIILPTAAIKWPTDQVRMVLKHDVDESGDPV